MGEEICKQQSERYASSKARDMQASKRQICKQQRETRDMQVAERLKKCATYRRYTAPPTGGIQMLPAVNRFKNPGHTDLSVMDIWLCER